MQPGAASLVLPCRLLVFPVVEGWLDLAKLVAAEGSKTKGPYEDLAFKIGGCTVCTDANNSFAEQFAARDTAAAVEAAQAPSHSPVLMHLLVCHTGKAGLTQYV